MGFILGLIILTAIFSTVYLICKYKNVETLREALDEIELHLRNTDNE